MMRTQLNEQRGSLPMVLLAAIVLGGIVVVLFGTVRSGVESARNDRDYQQAIQIADAGIQEAYTLLAGVQPDDVTPPCPNFDGDYCYGTLSDDSESEFRWRYTRVGDFLWDVQSVGEYGDARRAVHAKVGQLPLYDVAILTRKFFTYNGGGGGTDPFPIGTFGDATVNGGPAIASLAGIMLYGEGPHNVNVSPEQVPQEVGAGPTTPNIAQAAFEDDGVCDGAPYYPVYPADAPSPNVRGQTYCVGTINFGNGTHNLTGPSDESVTIFVDQYGPSALSMGGSGSVNWSGVRDSSELQVYVAAGSVTVSGSSRIAAAVWAPKSACTSNGGTTIAGAMVCNSATLNGNFAYDSQVESILGTEFSVSGWREESVTG